MPLKRLSCRVELTQGKVAWVDAADYDAVMAAGPWTAMKGHAGVWYAKRHVKIGGKWVTQQLHTFLTGWPQVDHKDGDGLNCRRNNMREATSAQNNQNHGLRRDNRSGYKGVGWDKQPGRWRARIRADGKQWTIGHFDGPPPPAPKEAAEAYDRAALELFGEFARTNQMLGKVAQCHYASPTGTIYPHKTRATSSTCRGRACM
jgi:hypothetical protein